MNVRKILASTKSSEIKTAARKIRKKITKGDDVTQDFLNLAAMAVHSGESKTASLAIEASSKKHSNKLFFVLASILAVSSVGAYIYLL